MWIIYIIPYVFPNFKLKNGKHDIHEHILCVTQRTWHLLIVDLHPAWYLPFYMTFYFTLAVFSCLILNKPNPESWVAFDIITRTAILSSGKGNFESHNIEMRENKICERRKAEDKIWELNFQWVFRLIWDGQIEKEVSRKIWKLLP